MSEYTTCPIWKTPAIEQRTGDGETVDSPRAGGRYSITGRAVVILQSRDESLKSRLTISCGTFSSNCPTSEWTLNAR